MAIKLFERTEIDVTRYQSDTVRVFYASEREARREYSRLRSIAEKRIERLERVAKNEDDIISRDARRVVDSTGEFQKLSEIKGQEVYTQLERVARFLNSTSSSVSTLRERKEKQLESLRDNDTIKEIVKSMKDAQTAEDKDDIREKDIDNLLPLLDEDADEDIEDLEDEENVSDSELDALLALFEILDQLGLGSMKYNEDMLDYIAVHPDATAEEIAKVANEIMGRL